MLEKVVPGPVSQEQCIREAVSIHTTKIFDSCRDKDCLEDLRVYLTRSSQEIVDRAQSVKAGIAELVYAYIDVEPIGFNRGFYTVDIRYFYRITADAFVGTVRPVEITGLAVFDKRCVLFGGEGSAKTFASSCQTNPLEVQNLNVCSLPTAVIEAVDPLILGIKLCNSGDCCGCGCGCNFGCDNSCTELPSAVMALFSEELITYGESQRLYVTLGQFSLIRMERDTQLLVPIYDYYLPEKECDCSDDVTPEDPCEVFRQVKFPVEEFISSVAAPEDHCSGRGGREYRSCFRS